MRKSFELELVFLVGLTAIASCGDDGSDDADSDCQLGHLNCPCEGGLCLQGLECQGGFCVNPVGEGDGDGDGDGDSGDGDGAPGDGDGAPGDGDGDTSQCDGNELSCDGSCIDPMIDNENCGACGEVCIINAGEGGCANGSCAPTWSSCVYAAQLPVKSCDEVCALDGMQCAPQGCDGAVVWYGTSNSCEIDNFSHYSSNDCGQPIDSPDADYYRCCCQQP
jgi:hypothetical protein